MRPTSTSLIARWLNQQRPLDKRESVQLLNSLTSSFRKHLDREYPAGPAEAATRKDESTHKQSSSRSSAVVTTSNHLGMLLANPLLGGSPKDGAGLTSDEMRSDILRESPEQSFNRRILAGTLTLESASIYLAARLTHHAKPSGGTFAFGSQILTWLRSTQQLESRPFLEDLNLTKFLVSNLVLEGQYSVLKRWCSPKVLDLRQSKKIPRETLLTWMRQVSRTFVQDYIRHNGLKAGTNLLLELLNEDFADLRTKRQVFRPAQYVAVWEIGLASKETLESLTSYDKLMANANPIFLPFLEVHHPTRPTYEKALERIERHVHSANGPTPSTLPPDGHDRYNTTLLLSTARGLLENHVYDKASRVLQLIHDTYPEKVSMDDIMAISALAKQPAQQTELSKLQRLLKWLRTEEVDFLQWGLASRHDADMRHAASGTKFREASYGIR